MNYYCSAFVFLIILIYCFLIKNGNDRKFQTRQSHQKENRPVYINKLALLYQQPVDPVL